MAAEAQRRRLEEALREYVAAFRGDTGSRRVGLRSQIADPDRELVTLSEGLLTRLNGGQSTDATQRDTPGSRARDRASNGAGQTMDGAQSRALDLMRGATNGPAAVPAGGGNTEGGTP